MNTAELTVIGKKMKSQLIFVFVLTAQNEVLIYKIFSDEEFKKAT